MRERGDRDLCAPRQFESTVHAIHEMFPQRREEQRPVVLHPVVSTGMHEPLNVLLAFVQAERRFQVRWVVPISVSTARDRMRNRSIILNAQEKVDGGLFVRI